MTNEVTTEEQPKKRGRAKGEQTGPREPRKAWLFYKGEATEHRLVFSAEVALDLMNTNEYKMTRIEIPKVKE